MNQLHTDRGVLGSWGLTGLAGAVSTTAVAVLLSAVVSSPAYSAPANDMPAGPDTVAAVTHHRHAPAATPYCFMGRPGRDDSAALPACRL